MTDKIEKNPPYLCHAKFIYNHGQKPSLTLVTSSKISSVLFRLYPLLIIIDGALSNIMWICDDICLPLIHLVQIFLIINLLSLFDLERNPREIYYAGNLLNLWLGMMSGFLLVLSFLYYILTVYEDLAESEPPTLDDIVIVLESVVDKLETMRSEVLGRVPNIKSWFNVAKLILFFTPLHYFLMRFTSIKTYVLGFTATCLLYHSTWFQCTLKLFWRVLVTRKAYFALSSHFSVHQNIKRKPLLSAQNAIDNCKTIIHIPYPISLQGLKHQKLQLQLQLQKLYPWEKLINEESKYPAISKEIAIMEFNIDENQRKWRDTGWLHKMLPYERPEFSMDTSGCIRACESPWKFQEGLPEAWEWLDDCWRPTEWIFSDSEWNVAGTNDSLESCTRTRTWKRRIFTVEQ